jgi:ribosome biogenesis protein Tsr3
MIVQRQIDKRKQKEAAERHLAYLDENDPRKASARQLGRYDQARIEPLIKDEE